MNSETTGPILMKSFIHYVSFGTGKTFLISKILAIIRSQNDTVSFRCESPLHKMTINKAQGQSL
ncbi:hypothetical protein FWK35_00006484 [Aphis craccivora]|uniref:Uncharacterized protein n=1 Tax=Aphis craccivora TaxID=307492 RepID=A0A6G0ZBY8_APHCR|nr:hypothetical protein FWK35_00006484 [Aphis craccivora]